MRKKSPLDRLFVDDDDDDDDDGPYLPAFSHVGISLRIGRIVLSIE